MRHRLPGRAEAQLIEDEGIKLDELTCQCACLARTFFLFQAVDQIDGIVETHPFALMDGGHAQGGGEVGLTSARATDKDQVVGIRHELGGGELFHLRLGHP